jgi:tRNA nucleotidyltransferase/poly(A) polymerase
MGSFKDFKLLREQEEKSKKGGKSGPEVDAKVSLGDGNDFDPFVVSDDKNSEHYGKNKNLAPVVRAFKKGGNWGWSKDDGSGEDKPVKIGAKKLFLVGGPVRDHLKGRKPKDMELATNASPDEVYHLLKQNDFQYVEDPGQASGDFAFWVKKTNKSGRPFVFGVKSYDDEYNLTIFTKTPKGNVDMDPESGTHGEDAAGRDFTMNAMYLALTNDNGPNKELHDFYGGIHDLNDGRVRAVGDMSKKFKEDPTRLLRYARMVDTYGDSKNISAEDKDTIAKSVQHLSKLKPDQMMGELKKALDRDDGDGRKTLMLMKKLGMLDSMFPGKQIDSDLPKELSELGDKHMPLAYMLRMNHPDSLKDSGLDEDMLRKVRFLIKSLSLNDNLDEEGLEDLVNSFRESGVSTRKLKAWAEKVGKLDPSTVDAFITHLKSPRVKAIVSGDEGEEVAEGFKDLFDPFDKKVRNPAALDDRIRQMEWMNFRKLLGR